MNRFYFPSPMQIAQTLMLDDRVYHHWIRVLRAEVGEAAVLFNGQGGEYTVRITSLSKRGAEVFVESFDAIDRTGSAQVTLGQVMSKGDRMDYAIQKATELGVHKIQLLTSERCEMRLKYERDQKKLEHWQAVAIAACEQCGLNRVPVVHAPLPLEQWFAQPLPQTKLVLAPNIESRDPLINLSTDIAVLVGPEGGLSQAEIASAVQAGFSRWCIGERVLRTETAPVVALSILQYNCAKSGTS